MSSFSVSGQGFNRPMWTASEFGELVSGRRKGLAAATLRGILRLAEAPYAAAVDWRNQRYERGRATIERVDAPVVSVGNLTLGGTGKTPLVKWLARWFADRGRRAAIVSRGYGSMAGRPNDEALELQSKSSGLPDVPHLQNPDRVVAARAAVEQHGRNLILLDDGFQHRRLARDLDIVLLDALEPFGFDHVFPRGTLREPLTGLRRADVVCLSRADAIDAAAREAIRQRVAQTAPNILWCEITHAPGALIDSAGDSSELNTLQGRRVVAFCGIGNPAGFRHTLATLGCQIAHWREFPDHHAYSESDLADLAAAAERTQADALLCTHKDLVKIDRAEIAGRPLWAVAIEIAFTVGQEEMEQALEKLASGT